MFDSAAIEEFVRVGAAGDRFGKIVDGNVSDAVFKSVAALIPAGEEFGPGDGRLGPFLLGLPFGHGICGRGEANALVPKEEMLEKSGDGMSVGEGTCRGKLGRRSGQEFAEGRPIPSIFEGGGAVGVGDLLCGEHGLFRARLRGMFFECSLDFDGLAT